MLKFQKLLTVHRIQKKLHVWHRPGGVLDAPTPWPGVGWGENSTRIQSEAIDLTGENRV